LFRCQDNNKLKNMEPCKRAQVLSVLLALPALLTVLPTRLGAQAGSAGLHPVAGGLPGLQPSETAERLAPMAEPLSAEAFLQAALAFSGARGPGLEEARARVRALAAEAVAEIAAQSAAGPGSGSVRARAEGLLQLLHRRAFRQYDERQTRLDELLATGRFNCVSSAVLYGLLARFLGLEFRAVQTADHAFIRVLAGAQGWDVETTNLYGFDPGSRREFTDSFGRVTGYSYVPPGQYARRRELGDKGLLSLILYNRNAYDTEAGRYLEALQPAVDAHAVRRDSESLERLTLSSLNVASFYGRAGRYEEGTRFLEEAARGLEDPRLARVREDLLHNWAVSLIQAGRLEEAQELIDRRRAGGGLPEEEWRSLGVSIWQLRAREVSRRDFGEAARILLEALRSLGPEPGLVSGYEVYVHNQMASLVNSGRVEEARRVLREALRVLPASSLLREDEARLASRHE
jgi:tetratricopeptide (TPR) repeat protein